MTLFTRTESFGRTYVAVANNEFREIIGYFTVSPDPIELRTDEDIYEDTHIIRLERLAVDIRYQGQGIGKWILTYLINEIVLLEKETNYKVDALELQALNQKAENWYLGLEFGFIDLIPGRGRLILYIETMRQLLDINSNSD